MRKSIRRLLAIVVIVTIFSQLLAIYKFLILAPIFVLLSIDFDNEEYKNLEKTGGIYHE